MIRQQDIDQFYIDLENMKLVNPGVAMMAASGLKSSGTVSDYLNKKKNPSERFIKSFYEKVYKTSEKALSSGLDIPLAVDIEVKLSDYISLLKEKAIKAEQREKDMQSILEKTLDRIDINLETVKVKAEGIQLDLISARRTALKSLARIENKPEMSLLNDADKLKTALAVKADELGKSVVAGK